MAVQGVKLLKSLIGKRGPLRSSEAKPGDQELYLADN